MREQPSEGPASGRRFEDLWIWQAARDLVCDVYRDFGPGSPGERDFGFRNQIQRAAVSVMSNIAEGHERDSDKQFSYHLAIAKGSSGEVRSLYHVAEALQYVTEQMSKQRRAETRRLAAGIRSMIAHLDRKE